MNMFEVINLQMFAEPVYVPEAYTEVNTTMSPGLTGEMKTFYDRVLLREAGPQLVHDQFGQKRPIPKGNGKTIEFRKFLSLPKATTPLVEGVTPLGGALTQTSITAEVEQFGYYVVQSDVLELTAIDNTILEATMLLGQQAGVTLDTIVRNVLNSGTNVTYAPRMSDDSGVTPMLVEHRYDLDLTCRLSVNVVQMVVAKMRANNVPKIDGDYVCILHPYAAYDLMRDPEWIDAHKYATPENIYAGEIGKIAGVRFVETSEAKIFRAENLIEGSRNLTVAEASTGKVVKVSEELPFFKLAGRKVAINGVIATVKDNEGDDLTLDVAIPVNPGDKITPAECGLDDGAVFSCLFIGKGAYGVTEIEGGGLQTIVKQKGSGGTADPLDQRSSVGWKAMKTAEILNENYMVRVECKSPMYSRTAKAN